jgi:cation-transporting P-type ATPase C
VLAAILHNASSVAVVANSSRLIRYQLDRPVNSTGESASTPA